MPHHCKCGGRYITTANNRFYIVKRCSVCGDVKGQRKRLPDAEQHARKQLRQAVAQEFIDAGVNLDGIMVV